MTLSMPTMTLSTLSTMRLSTMTLPTQRRFHDEEEEASMFWLRPAIWPGEALEPCRS
jgi:hypothetical protein